MTEFSKFLALNSLSKKPRKLLEENNKLVAEGKSGSRSMALQFQMLECTGF